MRQNIMPEFIKQSHQGLALVPTWNVSGSILYYNIVNHVYGTCNIPQLAVPPYCWRQQAL